MSLFSKKMKHGIVMLLVFAMMLQIVGPTVYAYADSDDTETELSESGSEGEDESSGETTNPETSANPETSDNDLEDEGTDTEGSDGDRDVAEGDGNADTEGDDTDELEQDGELDGVPQSEAEGVNFKSTSYGIDSTETISSDEITMNFIKLSIEDGGSWEDIVDSEDAKDIELKAGQAAEVYYSFDLEIEKVYEAGSSFTFQLPQSLLVFDSGSLSGTVNKDGEPPYSYETDESGVVTVTFFEGISFGEYKIDLDFSAKFGNFNDEDELDQEIEIPIAGEDSITIELKFLPSTSDKKMSKKSTSVENIEGVRYINWEVWVNEAGKELNNATFGDTPGDGHELVLDSISVEKYKVGINGVIEAAENNTINISSGFPLTLDDGIFAYKITYKTKVTRIPSEEKETFENTAKLINDGNEEPAFGEVDITYGTPLSKSEPEGDKYRAKWEIKYNYLGAAINSNEAKIVDVLEGAHEIDKTTIKVYEVTIDSDGNETVGTEPLVEGEVGKYLSTLSEDKQTLTIDFSKSASDGKVTKAFKVVYDTIPTSEFITSESDIKNIVTSTNKDSSGEAYTAERGYTLTEGIFGKSRSSIDYNNKVITWKLEINAEKDMNNFKIVDQFTETNGNTYQELLGDNYKTGVDKYFDISITPSGNYNSTDITLEGGIDESEGYTLSFVNKIPAGTKIEISYKTKFIIASDGTAYAKYGNSATATWKGTTDTEYSITKEAKYEPEQSPTGKNGYKKGNFDYVKQEFTWEIAVNINRQNINNATLKDTLGPGHHIPVDISELENHITIYQLNLSNNDTGTRGNELSRDKWDVNAADSSENGKIKEYTITFKGLEDEQETQAYLITYTSVDEDNILGRLEDEKGTGVYTNAAVFSTTKDYPLDGKVTVNHSNDLIGKKAVQNPNEETITWTIDINKSHSNLGNIVLTDILSANQLLLKDTFRICEYTINDKGIIGYKGWESVSVDKLEFTENGFILDLGELNRKGYQVEYKTFFTGADNEMFTNTASISYGGENIVDGGNENNQSGSYKFNSSSGNISSNKGSVRLHKVGLDTDTGEKINLNGVTFGMYNKTGVYKLYEATSNSDGELVFKNVRYGSYLIKEEKAPDGYTKSQDITFKMDATTDILLNVNEDKIIEVINEKINQAVRLTKIDKDDVNLKLEGAKFDLYKKGGELVSTHVTDEHGEITVNNLPVGEYYFIETEAPKYYILPIGDNAKTGDFTIIENQKELEKITVTNSRGKGSIVIKKVDSANNTILIDGVEFEISNEDGTWSVKKDTENGIITFSDLFYGVYFIKETQAHPDYVPNQDSIRVELIADTPDEEFELIVENTKKNHSVRLIKYNSSKSLKLEGAIFELRKETIDGRIIVVPGYEQLTTDKNGEIYLENLEPGEYQFAEVRAPRGYDRNRTPVEFTIAENQTTTVEVEKTNRRTSDPDPDPEKPEKPEKEDPGKPGEEEDPGKPEEDPDPETPGPGPGPEIPGPGPEGPEPETPGPGTERPPVEETTEPEKPVEVTPPNIPEGSVPEVKEPPKNGTVTFDENGKWIYTPNPGFTGEDTFIITITHPNGTTEDILITVNVAHPKGNVLPKTGEFNHPIVFYIAGVMMIGLGVILRRKTVKS